MTVNINVRETKIIINGTYKNKSWIESKVKTMMLR